MSDATPRRAEDLDVHWLGAHLSRSRYWSAGAPTSVAVHAFAEGIGVLGKLSRLVVSTAAPPRGTQTSTLVVKFPSDAASNRALARGMRLYQREIDFYTHAAHGTPFRVPLVHHMSIDGGAEFVLLMEDVVDVRMCDQVAGASETQLRRLVPALASHHATFWGTRADLSWAVRFDDPTLAEIIEGIYRASVEPALEKFRDAFSHEMAEVARALSGRIGAIWSRLCTSPTTLVHGDFRLDNVGFAKCEPGDDRDVVCFDWQISGVNVGTYDLGFLMSQSVEPETREPIEHEVVRSYHEALVAAGIDDYDHAACFDDYCRTVLVCLIYPVIVCGMLDVGNERGRQFGRASLRRSVSAIEALEAHRFLDAT